MEEINVHQVVYTLYSSLNEVIFLCLGIIIVLLCNILNLNRASFFVTLIAIIAHFLQSVDLFKVAIHLSALLTIIISGRKQRSEFYIMILSVLLGANLLMASENLIMVLLSMELISISSYVLTVGFQPDKKRAEAAWKFFIYGSVATAIMIFGMTYTYGASGDLFIGHIGGETPLETVGGLMIVAGLLFKMTAAPLHLWAPDVYEATPAPIVAFLSVVPKIAAVFLLLNMNVYNLGYIAIFTIIVGTLAAINQSDVKRMMAYSSVSQAGFFLAALLTTPQILQFYVVIFAIMNYTVFIVIHEQEKQGLPTNFTDFSGFGHTSTFAAVAATIGLVSLTGLPPTAGFMGKLLIFSDVWKNYAATGSVVLLSLFVVGLLATVASLFFYLKIPFYAFFRRDTEKPALKIPLFTNLLLIILVGLLLALFIAPGLLMG